MTSVDYVEADGVATLTLNRPDRLNAVDRSMVLELVAAIDRAEQSGDVGAIVITGAGRAFCAGADLSNGPQTFAADLPDATIDDFRDYAGLATLRVFDCTKPVIGAINGAAVGFGASLACAMDIRVVSRDATFAFAFARRGMVPEGACGWFLPRLVGPGKALEWTLTGRPVTAEEAQAAGLANVIQDADEVVDAARGLAADIIQNNAPISLALTRALIWNGLVSDHPRDVHRADSRATFLRGRSRDVIEGIEAFLEKRPARFPQALDELPSLTWPHDEAS